MRAQEIKTGDLYRHFKGKNYRIIGVGCHSESLQEMVIYEALYENPKGRLWVRPLEMFLETVTDTAGKSVPRFARIS
jgi:hypothetical protein